MTGTNEINYAELDFRDVSFPSDKLTIEALRRKNWGLFDDGFHVGENQQPQFFYNSSHGKHAGDVVANMLFCERAVVAHAFAEAVDGRPPEISKDDAASELTRLYEEYGLAEGRRAATMLVDDLKAAGKEMGGTGGPWNYQPRRPGRG